MSTRYSVKDWSLWLEEYRQSGLSVKQFCDLIEVSTATFYNWQRKLKNLAENGAAPEASAYSLVEANFAEAFLSPSLLGGAIEIQLPAGASVNLPNDADSLRPVLQVLAEIGIQS